MSLMVSGSSNTEFSDKRETCAQFQLQMILSRKAYAAWCSGVIRCA